MRPRQLRLGILGCGALTRTVYVPVLAGLECFRLTMLVDKNRRSAEELAESVRVAAASDDWHDVVGRVDAVINVLPNHLHAPVTMELLRAGLPVLVEKPMALRSEDCRAMSAVSREVGVPLSLGMVRRFFSQNRFVKALVDSGALGKICAVEVDDGAVFNWPLSSGALFDRKQSGGGVLMDAGVHVLDLLHWWFGRGQCLSYEDDSAGGVESDCTIGLEYPNDLRAVVRLSRVRDLRNRILICGEDGEVECGVACGSHPRMTLRNETVTVAGGVGPARQPQTTRAAFAAQLVDFHRVIATGSDPLVRASDGADVLALIEQCYTVRGPSIRVNGAVSTRLAGETVLISGGTGFIGSALAERLASDGVRGVRVLVRDFARAARISRHNVELIPGDVLDAVSVERAMRGCSVVFHCAYGNRGDTSARWAATVDGTRNLVNAAAAARVRKFVHVSTQSVYGNVGGPFLDETAQRKRRGDPYGDSKLEAENLALGIGRASGLHVTVLQPTAVYGPFAPSYTERILRRMRTHRLILVNGGEGTCNAVFIDDVVGAMLLAAANDQVFGERFLVSGPGPCRWRQFFGAYEQMFGRPTTVSMTVREALTLYRASIRKPHALMELMRALRQNSELRSRLGASREGALIRACLRISRLTIRRPARSQGRAADAPAVEAMPPIYVLDPAAIHFFAVSTSVDISKARRVLGYDPECSLAIGMARTKAWAEWARLVPESDVAGPTGATEER